MIEATSSESNQEVVEFQRSISDGFSEVVGTQKSSSKNMRLYCFACHRLEYHYNALKGTSYHHLLIGFTFGLAWLFGPFRCRCCGHRRMARFNFLNPRYYYHRWKYSPGAKKSKSSSSSSKSSSSRKERRQSRDLKLNEASGTFRADVAEESPKRRRRKSKRLKSVPIVDTIGKERRQRQRVEEYVQAESSGAINFSLDGVVDSFETEESRKQKLDRIAEERANRGPFAAKKAKPRKKLKGKPKRRFAKKERLTGPTVYCFSCKQKNEHYHVLKGSAYYSFLFGITFGLSAIIGPFRCSVCSKKRLSISDALNPKYLIRNQLSNSRNGYGS